MAVAAAKNMMVSMCFNPMRRGRVAVSAKTLRIACAVYAPMSVSRSRASVCRPLGCSDQFSFNSTPLLEITPFLPGFSRSASSFTERRKRPPS